MEEKIRKIFNILYYEKNIELIGISSVTDKESKFDINGFMISSRLLKYTAALKQGKYLIPVLINSTDNEVEIREHFISQLAPHNLNLVDTKRETIKNAKPRFKPGFCVFTTFEEKINPLGDTFRL
ncbi:hypothetical protein BH10BAC5_BH10BAC5_14680 [soil metagenome]